jgi:putative protease
MEMAFSRGLYTGWFRGVNNQQLVHASFGKKRGVYLGEVVQVSPDSVDVRLEQALKPGDGVVFDAGMPEEKEEGGRVYEVRELNHSRLSARQVNQGRHINSGTTVRLWFGDGDIDFSRIDRGDKVWKTSDPKLERDLRRSYEGEQPKFQRPISIEVHGHAGLPLTLMARDREGRVVRCDSTMPLVKAQAHPLTVERLREQLGRLGGTPFFLAELNSLLGSDLILPVSELNQLRRRAVQELEALRSRGSPWTLRERISPEAAAKSAAKAAKAAELIVLVRNLAQLQAAMRAEASTVYCDFEDPKKYREAVEQFRTVNHNKSDTSIFVAPPRIFKMGEDWTLSQVHSSQADGYLIRNYDHLRFFANDRKVGDYSLNVANHLSADYFKNKFGLERITASYDLNFNQLEALLQGAPAEWFEVTIHQHMPMFHMEHCVFCAFLSSGTDYTNCGRPCDKHSVQLRDRVGAQHPIKADAGCRNTVYNARAQTGAEYAQRMLSLGARHFRIEFVDERPEQVSQTIDRYRLLLEGKLTGTDLWLELKLLNQLGVTRGQIAG